MEYAKYMKASIWSRDAGSLCLNNSKKPVEVKKLMAEKGRGLGEVERVKGFKLFQITYCGFRAATCVQAWHTCWPAAEELQKLKGVGLPERLDKVSIVSSQSQESGLCPIFQYA